MGADLPLACCINDDGRESHEWTINVNRGNPWKGYGGFLPAEQAGIFDGYTNLIDDDPDREYPVSGGQPGSFVLDWWHKKIVSGYGFYGYELDFSTIGNSSWNRIGICAPHLKTTHK